VEITAALAAELAMLSDALDATEDGIVEGLARLTVDAKLAVPSYVGLTLTAHDSASPLSLTAMEDHARQDDVVSSLAIPLSDGGPDAGRVVVILYAAQPGAFVDLAADLSWLTGRSLADFVLDEHLGPALEPDAAGGVQAASLVNQAIGILLARGYTPERAAQEIDARAAAAGHTRAEAAAVILGEPPPGRSV
jgi:hypothetical protein